MSDTFGERLRDLRKEKNLLQSEFASIVGLSSSAIGSYERNEREPAYSQLVTFADFFSVSLDYLFGRTDERMTVKDYTAKDTFQLQDLLNERNVLIGSYELQGEDKQRIYAVSHALVHGVGSVSE